MRPASSPTETFDVQGSYYEDGNRLIGAFSIARGACVGIGTFDVRRSLTAPMSIEANSADVVLVIVDTDGNLVRHEVRVLR